MSKFVLSAFADEISQNLNEQIENLQKNEISYLEFRNVEGKCIIDYTMNEVKAIGKQLEDNGIGVSAVGSPIGKILIIEAFEEHLDRFKKTLEVAHALKTPNIRMFSFFIPRGDDPAMYRDEVLERWSRFIDAAKGSGITLLHENEKEIYGDIPERCLDLLKTLNCSYVKGIFDPANFIQCDVETYPHGFELLKDQIVYMHIKDALYKDHSVVPAGQGDGKVKEILKELHDSDFEGFLSIEPHLNKSLPGGGPGRFAIAANALKGILADL